jgi:hypothetical protein
VCPGQRRRSVKSMNGVNGNESGDEKRGPLPSESPDRSGPSTQRIGTSPRMRDQPSLTTASGRSWLLLGGLLAFIAVAVMVPMLSLDPPGVALFGICAVVAFYTGMIVTKINARRRRWMLGLMASFMIAIAVVGLICVGVVAAHAGGVV